MDDPPDFTGFAPEAFSWFEALQADNSKGWFAAHRETYDRAVRGALEALLEQLAIELGGSVKLFRQHRDTRFSTDKSPYKTTTYGLITDRPDSRAPLYAQLSATGLFAGTGYHALAADQLARFRAAVAADATGPALETAIATAHGAAVETFGEALKTAPRGYPRDHPRAGLLRHKSLIAGRRLQPAAGGAIAAAAALEHARATWEACAPMNAWLDEHVGASEIPLQSRYGRRL
ncbi:MAG: hypothetical protein QOE11_1474 [Solirubrobacteraceae bacterium]|jgi:uncharacterized protein (TIGR02453 family)|nr:hypothetical protein [Solirubrobacteraceae bacterium]